MPSLSNPGGSMPRDENPRGILPTLGCGIRLVLAPMILVTGSSIGDNLTTHPSGREAT